MGGHCITCSNYPLPFVPQKDYLFDVVVSVKPEVLAKARSRRHWMGHVPQTMSELYSHLSEELEMRLEEAEKVGYGSDLPKSEAVVAPNAPKKSSRKLQVEIAA